MQRDWICKTGRLAGTSEFTVLAPIKPGLVPALDAVSYKSRAMRVLRTLHAGRTAGFEHELARVLTDAVERVGRIHSVSIRVLEPQDAVMLAVVFDGAWDAYVRVIWQKVTRLLDLVFCNTIDYPLGWDSSFDTWSAWLHSVQTTTSFLYATPGLTVPDTRWLRLQERLQRRGLAPATQAATQAELLSLTAPTAESIADAALFGDASGQRSDLNNPVHGQPPLVASAAFRHGVRSLVGLHRLVDWHASPQADAEVLRRAAHELLPEFVHMDDPTFAMGRERLERRFPEALAWFDRAPDTQAPDPANRRPPALPDVANLDQPDTVQGGIVTTYPAADHGVLLLLAFASPAGAAALLANVGVTTEATTRGGLAPGAITVNIGLTPAGLRQAGVTEAELRCLPEAFMQGMAERAGWLGDLRANHPRRWRLPMRNWADTVHAADAAETDPGPRVAIEAVHAVLQLRHCVAAGEDRRPLPAATVRSLLFQRLQVLVDLHADIVPLSLQWMVRLPGPAGADGQPAGTVEHFGFSDGHSDPVFNRADAGPRYAANQVHLGEALCGHANQADEPPTAPPDSTRARALALQHNGSYWVVRKLRQDVGALEKHVAAACAQRGAPGREELLSKLMGRWPSLKRDGQIEPNATQPRARVLDPSRPNDFNFNRDPKGLECPLQAHMRLSNPRITDPEKFTRPPRLLRRGMSYGPPVKRDETDANALNTDYQRERGLVFMAYNASIGEQFEVVQRWLMGGNPTGGFSGHNDPFLGLPEPGQRRSLSIAHKNAPMQLLLDGSDTLQDEPTPLVRLEWGIYLLAPSTLALQRLAALAAAQRGAAAPAWDWLDGARQIRRLQTLEAQQGAQAAAQAWKQTLEDPESNADFDVAAIWQAIQKLHGGVLRTPFGVLVADAHLVEAGLLDAGARLSARGYLGRLQHGLGEMYLGLDAEQADGAYERESQATNAAIMALPAEEAFQVARAQTLAALDALVKTANDEAGLDGEPRWQLSLGLHELVEPVLAHFCEIWFGLSTAGGHFQRGGLRWDWNAGEAPSYPGHFIAPSRHVFQPLPGPAVEDLGMRHGQAVRTAMQRFLRDNAHAIASAGTARVACAILGAGLDTAGTHDFSARTLAGAVMGFVPTVDGNLRRIAHEWLRDGQLWSLRGRHAGGTPAANLGEARQRLGAALLAAMQLRAVPDLMWRTATLAHTLGSGETQVQVQPGDRVVMALAAVTQQRLCEGPTQAAEAAVVPGADLAAAFGGDRWAHAHPTHACPGSRAAMAVLLGFFSALVETPHALRPGPGPLTLATEGATVPPPAGPADAAAAAAAAGAAAAVARFKSTGWAELRAFTAPLDQPVPQPVATAAAPVRLLHVGDSWLAAPLAALQPRPPTLYQALIDRGCQIDARLAMAGRLLATVADAPRLQQLERHLLDIDPDPNGPDLPAAILLTAGGNDLVYDRNNDPARTPLHAMLVPGATTGKAAIDDTKLALFLKDLRIHYDLVLQRISDVSATAKLPRIPILVHGYDHPIPNANGYSDYRVLWRTVRVGPWLYPVFKAAGMTDATVQRDAMNHLIEELNKMVAGLETDHPGWVHHLDLTGLLDKVSSGQPQTLWENELHPTQAGFGHVADACLAKLRSIGAIP